MSLDRLISLTQGDWLGLTVVLFPLLALALPLFRKWKKLGWACWILVFLYIALAWSTSQLNHQGIHGVMFYWTAKGGIAVLLVTILAWFIRRRNGLAVIPNIVWSILTTAATILLYFYIFLGILE